MNLSTPEVLEQRLEFLESVLETAVLCNWVLKDREDLAEYVLSELVIIDNVMFDTFEETGDRELSYLKWEGHMEELRHWLTLILEVKIKYI